MFCFVFISMLITDECAGLLSKLGQRVTLAAEL